MKSLWDEKTFELEMETDLMIEDLRAATDRIKSASMRAQVAYMDDQPLFFPGLVTYYDTERVPVEWHIMAANMAAVLRTQTINRIETEAVESAKPLDNEYAFAVKVTVRDVLLKAYIRNRHADYFKRLIAGAVYEERREQG